MSSGILKDRLENEEVNRLGGSANLGAWIWIRQEHPAPLLSRSGASTVLVRTRLRQ